MKLAPFFPDCRISTLIAAVLLLILLVPAAHAQDNQTQFSPLKQKLLIDSKSGLAPELINAVFSNPKLQFETKGISSYFRHQESKLNYDQFLSDKSLQSARDYMQARMGELQRAEKAFGVEKEIITAIMLVETRLGTYTGTQDAINILATMAALSDKGVRDAFYSQIPVEGRLTREKYDKKANDKSEWAYRELKALLTYTSRDGFDPFTIKSSYAGALGIAQFMPSNILTLAYDGNADGKINLFEHEDAIFSIAKYLKHYGWAAGISEEKAKKVLRRYNNSGYYVDILMKISDRLKTGLKS